MAATKEAIIADIRRTASENGGVPLGQNSFERDTGISVASWRGKYWRTWGEALKDAGFTPNQPKEAHDELFLILSLAKLTRKKRALPDLRRCTNGAAG